MGCRERGREGLYAARRRTFCQVWYVGGPCSANNAAGQRSTVVATLAERNQAYTTGERQGQTARDLALPRPKSQLLSAVDEPWRAALMAPVVARWQARAANPDLTGAQRELAMARVGAIGRSLGRRIDACGGQGVMVKCSCPTGYKFRPFGCRQWMLCGRCRAERAPQLGRRIREGLRARLDEQLAAWRADPSTGRDGKPRLVMLTLTVRHSGDLAADRDALARGWRAFYLSLGNRIARWHYAMVWEVTPSDGGHIHAHVAVIWPYVPWGVEQARAMGVDWNVRDIWRESCPESERINMVASRRDRKPSTPSSIANYLGKYLGKGCDMSGFSPSLRAEIAAATYNKRSVTPSKGFWEKFKPLCKCCDQPWRLVCVGWSATYAAAPDAAPDWIGNTPIKYQYDLRVDTEPW